MSNRHCAVDWYAKVEASIEIDLAIEIVFTLLVQMDYSKKKTLMSVPVPDAGVTFSILGHSFTWGLAVSFIAEFDAHFKANGYFGPVGYSNVMQASIGFEVKNGHFTRLGHHQGDPKHPTPKLELSADGDVYLYMYPELQLGFDPIGKAGIALRPFVHANLHCERAGLQTCLDGARPSYHRFLRTCE